MEKTDAPPKAQQKSPHPHPHPKTHPIAMPAPVVQIHISDTGFTARCRYEEAYVIPSQTGTNAFSSAPDNLPVARLISPWATITPDATLPPIESVPLGWSCPLCGTVEVEKLYWRAYSKPESEIRKLAAVERAAARGSRTNSRRIQKERLRERRLAVTPLCQSCFACPRCCSGDASLGGLHMRLTRGVNNDDLQFHVACPYCQWQSYRSFPSMETLLGYLSASDAHASREDTLRPWRRAQREANNLLRAAYLPAPTGKSKVDSYSLSKLAWNKYVELLRPDQKMPSKHHQDVSLHMTPSREVCFNKTPAFHLLSPGGSPIPLGVPNLNLATALRSASPRGAAEESNFAELEQQKVFDEIRERGGVYTSADGLHPSVAMDMLRDLFRKQQQTQGKHLHNPKTRPKLPSYVRTISVPSALWATGQDIVDASSGAKAPQFSDEAALVGKQQAAQLGLHPLFAGAAPDIDELQRAMLPLDVMSRHQDVPAVFSAPTRTGLKMDTPIPLHDDSALFPASFASPRPITARNIAASGPEAPILEALLTRPQFNALISSMCSYYVKHPQKTQISALALRLGQSCAGGADQVCDTFLLLNATADDDPDLQKMLRYWSDAPAREQDEDGLTARNCISHGTLKGPRFIPGSQCVALRLLPFIQCTGYKADKAAPGVTTLSFSVTNLGTQTIVLRGLRVVKQRLAGGSCDLQPVHSTRRVVPTATAPETWVRVSPRCSAAEAAAAGLGERGPASLPARLQPADSSTDPIISWEFAVSAQGGSEMAPGCSFVGLEIDADVFLRSFDAGSDTTIPVPKSYYQVAFGASIVW